MSSIAQDVAFIKDKADQIEPKEHYTLVMNAMGDLTKVTTYVLEDWLNEIQNELDNRVTCHICGGHAHGLYAPGRWECKSCRSWK